jgi:hypothetical protein
VAPGYIWRGRRLGTCFRVLDRLLGAGCVRAHLAASAICWLAGYGQLPNWSASTGADEQPRAHARHADFKPYGSAGGRFLDCRDGAFSVHGGMFHVLCCSALHFQGVWVLGIVCFVVCGVSFCPHFPGFVVTMANRQCYLLFSASTLPLCTLSQLMQRNPELGQLLNDPAILRQSLQLASNPVGAATIAAMY